MLNAEKYISEFARYVVQQSKTRLTRSGKSSSGLLYNSIEYDLEINPNSFSLQFFMADHGEFVDQGVSGTQKKYDTPFSFTTKMPPPKVIEAWISQKGIKGRDKKGKFISNKSLSFVIAQSIKRKGMKPTLFFTKPFQDSFERLPDEIVEQFGLDVEELIDHALNA